LFCRLFVLCLSWLKDRIRMVQALFAEICFPQVVRQPMADGGNAAFRTGATR